MVTVFELNLQSLVMVLLRSTLRGVNELIAFGE